MNQNYRSLTLLDEVHDFKSFANNISNKAIRERQHPWPPQISKGYFCKYVAARGPMVIILF